MKEVTKMAGANRITRKQKQAEARERRESEGFNAQKRYAENQLADGMARVTMWVPKEDKEKALNYGRKLRTVAYKTAEALLSDVAETNVKELKVKRARKTA